MASSRPATTVEVLHHSVFFSGHVQGVGFRYKTLQIAKEFEVSGFVRNLPDGRVQLEAEGMDAEVRGFVAEVNDRLSVYIRRTESHEEHRKQVFMGFTISY
ncbi:MAG: acylphosphatase [Puniceicoccaceae bacterium]